MKNKIALIGGDRRQTVLAELFAKRGYEVRLYGYFDKIPSGVIVCESVRQALNGSDTVILPIPLTRDSVHLNFGANSEKKVKLSELFALDKDKLFLAGSIPPIVKDYAAKEKIRLIDYYDSEEIRIGNAYLTAEGAVVAAASELDVSYSDARIAVTGFGRIAKALAGILVSLGADVTVAARKERDLELAEALGCKTLKIGLDMDKKSTLISLANSYDIIFNTVPSWIFDGAFFEKLSPETVLAELASAPGGFDLAALQGSDAKIISLQGIPGKYAPVSAGRLIFESIEKIFEKEKTL